jgi:hypothetical protein
MFYAPGTMIQAVISNATFTPAPEPMSVALLGSGLIGLSLIRRRMA